MVPTPRAVQEGGTCLVQQSTRIEAELEEDKRRLDVAPTVIAKAPQQSDVDLLCGAGKWWELPNTAVLEEQKEDKGEKVF